MNDNPPIDPSLSTAEIIREVKAMSFDQLADELRPLEIDGMIFVFGSNERGHHGMGAAKFALEYRGAVYGRGYGRFGQSFAVPTKNKVIETLPMANIEDYVQGFLRYAKEHPKLQFQVTCLGCGLAGLHHSDMAPLFAEAPDNCFFDTLWREWLPDAKFWGTF